MKKWMALCLAFSCLLAITIKSVHADTQTRYYRLPIALWHAYEDKASMGNAAIYEMANLVESDDKMTLYIGSDKLTVMDLTTSLVNLYYDNGSCYKKAKGYSYDLIIDQIQMPRARVFSMPIIDKASFLNVMVDPKVEPMGDDPIKARIKLDFAKAELIDKREAELVLIAERGPSAPLYDKDSAVQRCDKGMVLSAPAGAFSEPFTFYANEVRGEALTTLRNQYPNAISPLASVRVYRLEALGPIDEIAYDAQLPINASRIAYQPQKDFKIDIPLPEKDKQYQLYAMTDRLVKIDHTVEDNLITFGYHQFVPFALIANNDTSQVQPTSAVEQSSDKTSTSNPMTAASGLIDDDAAVFSKDNSQNIIAPAPKENLFVIVFSLVVILLILSVSIYFCVRFYRAIVVELKYAADLKRDRQLSKGGRQ